MDSDKWMNKWNIIIDWLLANAVSSWLTVTMSERELFTWLERWRQDCRVRIECINANAVVHSVRAWRNKFEIEFWLGEAMKNCAQTSTASAILNKFLLPRLWLYSCCLCLLHGFFAHSLIPAKLPIQSLFPPPPLVVIMAEKPSARISNNHISHFSQVDYNKLLRLHHRARPDRKL